MYFCKGFLNLNGEKIECLMILVLYYEEWFKRKSRILCRVNIVFFFLKDEIVFDCVI